MKFAMQTVYKLLVPTLSLTGWGRARQIKLVGLINCNIPRLLLARNAINNVNRHLVNICNESQYSADEQATSMELNISTYGCHL